MSPTTATIQEIIIPLGKFPHMYSDESVHSAVAQLFMHQALDDGQLLFEEILVIDRNRNYAGRLTIQDIFRCFFPSLFSSSKVSIFAGKKEQFTELSILLEDSFVGKCRRQGDLLIKQFMQPPLTTIEKSFHPLHAVEVLMKENVTILPAVDEKKLVGVVRLNDLFRLLASSCSLV